MLVLILRLFSSSVGLFRVWHGHGHDDKKALFSSGDIQRISAYKQLITNIILYSGLAQLLLPKKLEEAQWNNKLRR
jgi:hypothetical protein